MLWLATILVNIFLVYLALGLVFALAFSFRGVNQVDEGAVGASIWFRLLLLPGTIAFWPVLLRKWIRQGWKKKLKTTDV